VKLLHLLRKITMQTFKYMWLHIPSQQSGYRIYGEKLPSIAGSPDAYEPTITSRKEFLEQINSWNNTAYLQSKIHGQIEWMYIAQ